MPGACSSAEAVVPFSPQHTSPMKIKPMHIAVAVALAFALRSPSFALAQDPLAPPGAPTQPTKSASSSARLTASPFPVQRAAPVWVAPIRGRTFLSNMQKSRLIKS
jgi:hypothetical protein